MNPAVKSAHPEVQPLDSCQEMIASALVRLVTSCVILKLTFVPSPTRNPEAAMIAKVLTLGRICGGVVDRNAPMATPPRMRPPTEKMGSAAP